MFAPVDSVPSDLLTSAYFHRSLQFSVPFSIINFAFMEFFAVCATVGRCTVLSLLAANCITVAQREMQHSPLVFFLCLLFLFY